MKENAAAYGSLRTFYGPAGLNHDGSRFVFAATADDRGRAVFLGDTAAGAKRQIVEDTQGVRLWNDDYDLQAGPWSPDDRYFLCCVSNQMMICSADANQEKIVLDTGIFSGAVWLSPTEFACVTEQTNLSVVQMSANGPWERRLVLSRNVPMTSLTAISSDIVAWLEDGEAICRANLSGGDGAPVSAPEALQPANAAAHKRSGALAGRLEVAAAGPGAGAGLAGFEPQQKRRGVERDSAGVQRHEQPAAR